MTTIQGRKIVPLKEAEAIVNAKKVQEQLMYRKKEIKEYVSSKEYQGFNLLQRTFPGDRIHGIFQHRNYPNPLYPKTFKDAIDVANKMSDLDGVLFCMLREVLYDIGALHGNPKTEYLFYYSPSLAIKLGKECSVNIHQGHVMNKIYDEDLNGLLERMMKDIPILIKRAIELTDEINNPQQQLHDQ